MYKKIISVFLVVVYLVIPLYLYFGVIKDIKKINAVYIVGYEAAFNLTDYFEKQENLYQEEQGDKPFKLVQIIYSYNFQNKQFFMKLLLIFFPFIVLAPSLLSFTVRLSEKFFGSFLLKLLNSIEYFMVNQKGRDSPLNFSLQ